MAKKKKATKKKANKKKSKKTVKKAKIASKKKSKKTSRSSRSSSSKRRSSSSGDYSASFPASLSQETSFPGSTYKAYGLDRRESRFTGRRLAILLLSIVVVVILAIWGSYTGEQKLDDHSEPQAQEPQSLDNTEQGEGYIPNEEDDVPAEQEGAPSETVEQNGDRQSSKVYTVQVGDNLSKIAKKTLGDSKRYKEIMDLNGISSPSQIKVGQELKIPAK